MSIKYITEAHSSVYDNGFTTLPNHIHDDPNLSILAKALMWHLLRYATFTGFTHHDSTMRKHLGCGINKLEQLFSELTKAGYVRYELIRGERGKIVARKRQFSHSPIFTSTIETMGEVKSSKNPCATSISEHSTSPMVCLAEVNHGEITNTDLTLTNTYFNKPKENIKRKAESLPSVAGVGKGELDNGFILFWEAYPVKKGGKEVARKSFNKALKATSLAHILRSIEEQAQERAQKARVGAFVPEWPYPSTWLNQARWDDCTQSQEQIEKMAPKGKTKDQQRDGALKTMQSIMEMVNNRVIPQQVA